MKTTEELYNSIESIEDILKFVEEKRDEDLHLEFKQSLDLSSEAGKIKYARMLSGFANSDGGVVVWGVICSKNKNNNDIDCASDVKPIKLIDAFVSRLKELDTRLIDPLLDGIEHKVIKKTGDSNEGFAKTYIPFGKSGPYMAKGSQDRYYRRSKDVFTTMEQYEVRAAFFRETDADLMFVPQVITSASGNEVCDFTIIISLKNTGKRIAKYPCLFIRSNDANSITMKPLPGGKAGLPERVRGINLINEGWHIFAGSRDNVVYPDDAIDVVQYFCKAGTNPRCDSINDVEFEYRIVAENMQIKEGKYTLSADVILKSIIEKYQK